MYKPSNMYQLNCLLSNKNIKIANIDVTKIEKLDSLKAFYSRKDFKDISEWDISNVSHLSNVFDSFNKTFYKGDPIDLSKWNLQKVNEMIFTFIGADLSLIKGLELWDVSNVIRHVGTFHRCNLHDFKVSSWKFTKTQIFDQVFDSCEITEKLDLENLDTSNIVSMPNAFINCYFTYRPNLNKWNISKCTNIAYLFEGSNFNGYIDNWDTSLITNINGTFRKNLEFNGSLNKWVVYNVQNARGTFDCSNYSKKLNWIFGFKKADVANFFSDAYVLKHKEQIFKIIPLGLRLEKMFESPIQLDFLKKEGLFDKYNLLSKVYKK